MYSRRYTHSQMLWPNPEPDELSYENTYLFAQNHKKHSPEAPSGHRTAFLVPVNELHEHLFRAEVVGNIRLSLRLGSTYMI